MSAALAGVLAVQLAVWALVAVRATERPVQGIAGLRAFGAIATGLGLAAIRADVDVPFLESAAVAGLTVMGAGPPVLAVYSLLRLRFVGGPASAASLAAALMVPAALCAAFGWNLVSRYGATTTAIEDALSYACLFGGLAALATLDLATGVAWATLPPRQSVQP